MIAPILTRFLYDDTETRKRLGLDDQRTGPQNVQLTSGKKKLLNLKSTESQLETPELDTCPPRGRLSQMNSINSEVELLVSTLS